MSTITISSLEHQAFLDKIKSLEDQVNKLLSENNALKDKVSKLTQQLYGKKRDNANSNKNTLVNNKKPNNIAKFKRGRKPKDHENLNIDEIKNYDFKSPPSML